MISTVAVGTDGSATASRAVEVAADMARRYGARLALLSAFDPGDDTPPGDGNVEVEWDRSTAAQVREILSRTEQELRRTGLDVKVHADAGDPAQVLVRLAGECGADVLVIGNKGMHRRVLGSVPNTVTHRAPCSVFVVKTT
jgi:nucleotide-binding universal stress UspA family protein